jgi:hypothetical protein
MYKDVENKQNEVRNNILKSFAGYADLIEKAHQVGDIHPNGKWVWTQLPNGKYDWRTINGRIHKQQGGGTNNTNQPTSENSSVKIDQAAYQSFYKNAIAVDDDSRDRAFVSIVDSIDQTKRMLKKIKEKFPDKTDFIQQYEQEIITLNSKKKAIEDANRELNKYSGNNHELKSSIYKYESATSTKEAIKGGLYNTNDLTIEKFLSLKTIDMNFRERNHFDSENVIHACSKKLADVRKVVEAADENALMHDPIYGDRLKDMQNWAQSEYDKGDVDAAKYVMYYWLSDMMSSRKKFLSKYQNEAASMFINNYKYKHPKTEEYKIRWKWRDTKQCELFSNAYNNADDEVKKAEQLASKHYNLSKYNKKKSTSND